MPPRMPDATSSNELNLTRDAGASALQTIIKGVSEAASARSSRKALMRRPTYENGRFASADLMLAGRP